MPSDDSWLRESIKRLLNSKDSDDTMPISSTSPSPIPRTNPNSPMKKPPSAPRAMRQMPGVPLGPRSMQNIAHAIQGAPKGPRASRPVTPRTNSNSSSSVRGYPATPPSAKKMHAGVTGPLRAAASPSGVKKRGHGSPVKGGARLVFRPGPPLHAAKGLATSNENEVREEMGGGGGLGGRVNVKDWMREVYGSDGMPRDYTG